MNKPKTATPKTDVAVDAKAPNDPATTRTALNTPQDEQLHPANATVTTAEQPKAKSEQMTRQPHTAAQSTAEMKEMLKGLGDGTVTVDFGKAGKITGCLVLNSVPGAELQFSEGQQVTVVVPTEYGTTNISVDGRHIK